MFNGSCDNRTPGFQAISQTAQLKWTYNQQISSQWKYWLKVACKLKKVEFLEMVWPVSDDIILCFIFNSLI